MFERQSLVEYWEKFAAHAFVSFSSLRFYHKHADEGLGKCHTISLFPLRTAKTFRGTSTLRLLFFYSPRLVRFAKSRNWTMATVTRITYTPYRRTLSCLTVTSLVISLLYLALLSFRIQSIDTIFSCNKAKKDLISCMQNRP